MSALPRRTSALLVTATIGVALSLGAAAPAISAGDSYPSSVRGPFLKACTKTAAEGQLTNKQAARYCRLALSCIEDRLTLKEFKETVTRMGSGKRNPNAKVFTTCERQAIRQVM
jgi:hypothetical protein